MDLHARLRKLLETATHPTATDGERLNALDALRRISDKSGGLEKVLAWGPNDHIADELRLARLGLDSSLAENRQLRRELEVLNRKRANVVTDLKPSHGHVSERAETIVLEILSKEWQKLHKIHERARNKGYTGNSQATYEYLDALCARNQATRHEALFQTTPQGRRAWQAQSWRSKSRAWS